VEKVPQFSFFGSVIFLRHSFSLSIPGTCGLVVVIVIVVVGMKLYYADFAADIALCNFVHFF
jgi:hypothetical protein